MRRAGAAGLSILLAVQSLGPGAQAALAAATRGRSSSPTPVARVIPGVSTRINLIKPLALGASVLPKDLAVPAAVPTVPVVPAARNLPPAARKLAEPSALQVLPAAAPLEQVGAAAEKDFARIIGQRLIAGDDAEATATTAISIPDGARAEGLSPAHDLIRSKPRASTIEVMHRSAWFPARLAAWTGSGAGLFALVASVFAPGITAEAAQQAAQSGGILSTVASVAAWTLLVPAAVFAAGAVVEAALFFAVKIKGRGATDRQFYEFLVKETLAQRLDPGVAEILRSHHPDSWKDLSLGHSSAGLVFLRPELAAWPAMFYRVLAHEFVHRKAHQTRGPPRRGLKGWWRVIKEELAARGAEIASSEVKVSELERVARKSRTSLRLGKPYDVLVLNAAEGFKDPAVYKALSGSQARVRVEDGESPQALLQQAAGSQELKAVVLGRAAAQLPKEGSLEWRRLSSTLRQLDSLMLLSSHRSTRQDAGFAAGSAEERRYQELGARAAGLSPAASGKEVQGFQAAVRKAWRSLSAERLKDLPAAGLLESLYAGLQNKGTAYLSFAPGERGMLDWQQLARFWEAKDGGRFLVSRVDLENGGHHLVLRKMEARVGLWLLPRDGAVKISVPDAAATDATRALARKALIEGGFKDHAVALEELQRVLRGAVEGAEDAAVPDEALLERARAELAATKLPQPLAAFEQAAAAYRAAPEPQALSALEAAVKTARDVLEKAGYRNYLSLMDRLGVEVNQVFGADVGSQAIYVTVPRKHAGAIKGFVAGSSVEVQPGRNDIQLHLKEAGAIHQVAPVHRIGITGAGGELMVIDTGGDFHQDFASRLDQLDMVHEGPEDWIGHGTHVLGIAISDNSILGGMAKGARAVIAKVFSRDTPGASDGPIMGAGTIGHQRGVRVISMSLGIRGNSTDTLAAFFSRMAESKTTQGEYVVIVASAGNSGPFDETLSQPGAGVGVVGVAAAAKSEDDGIPEIAFYSSVGPDIDRRYSIRRVRFKPDLAAVGGDVTTKSGSPKTYEHGVLSAKSRHMPARPDDHEDGQHTYMSGTSMAAPMIAGIVLLVDAAIRLTRLPVKPFFFTKVWERLPGDVKLTLMRSAEDLGVPLWFQGAGMVNAWGAVKLVFALAGRTAAGALSRLPLAGRLFSDGEDSWAWVERHRGLIALEDKVFSAAELARSEAMARFEANLADGEDMPPELRQEMGNAAANESAKKFDEARRAALPEFLAALVDRPAQDGAAATKKDPVWLNRMQAALALLNLRAPESAMALAEAALGDSDARVRRMALMALAELPTHEADALLQKASEDKRPEVSLYAAYALARHGDRGGVAKIVERISDKDKAARFSAVWLVGQLGPRVSSVEAEAVSAKVADANERGNIRHLAAAALFNTAGNNPDALSDKVVTDLLDACGPQNLALARTIAKFFPEALRAKAFVERMRADPLKAAVTAWVLKHRAQSTRPGAMGELVKLLSRVVNVPLDMPTPLPDPSGQGVLGVDPALGALDILVEPPSGRGLSVFRGPESAAEALAEAGLDAAFLKTYESDFRAGLPLSNALWLSVPEHKLYSFAVALQRRGYTVRLSAGFRSAARRGALSARAFDAGEEPFSIPEPSGPLLRLSAGGGASEARLSAALEQAAARAPPLWEPLVVSVDAVETQHGTAGSLRLLLERLVTAGVGVVLPAGNEGPFEGTATDLAGSGLPVVVTAVGASGLQFYSARSREKTPTIDWADWVDDLGIGQKPSPEGSYGTGAAAERTAEKLAGLAARMARAFRDAGRPLPQGWYLYLADQVRGTLSAVPGAGAYEAGGGHFDSSDKAAALQDEALKDLDAVEAQSKAVADAARRARPDAALPAAAQAAWQAALSAAKASLLGPAAAVPALAGAAAGVLGGDGLKRLGELKEALGEGPSAFKPFVFHASGGAGWKARTAGLEGFLYSKLELQSGASLAEGEVPHYFDYLDALLAPYAWAAEARAQLSALRASTLAPADKSAALDLLLIERVREWRGEIERLDPSLWLREASIYMALARAYNRLRPGKNFLDSLDEEALLRIKETTGSNTVWLLDIFEIGQNPPPWGSGGGSPYSIKGYRVKAEHGGDAALKRLVARAKRLGMEVGVDQIPNHVSLDSDLVKAHPEALLHIPIPRELDHLSDEEILAAVPRHGPKQDPVFHLTHSDNYPQRDGSRGPRRVLLHHPLTDYGGDMWVDMAQRDFTESVTRLWEAAEGGRMVGEFGVNVLRRDMAYEVLNARYYPRWRHILSEERGRTEGWMRELMDKMIIGFDARWKSQGGVEFLSHATAAPKAANPSAAVFDEIYSHTTEISRAGSDAVYNKNSHDLSRGQVGLYDAMVSRDGDEIRAALKNAAFRLWQKGAATVVNFVGTHDGGEGNPVDKFGKQFKAAALTALLLRPILVYNGLELGSGRKDQLIMTPEAWAQADKHDGEKAIPFNVPVLLNWAAVHPENAGFVRFLLAKSRDYKAMAARGALDVLEGEKGSSIVAYSLSGDGKTVIAASNYGAKASSTVRFKAALASFGAFKPVSGRIYKLRDVANVDSAGREAVYTRTGDELLSKGLTLILEEGGVHLFEVEEIAETPAQPVVVESAAPVQTPTAPADSTVVPSADSGENEQRKSGFSAAWDKITKWMVVASLFVFAGLQAPQIYANFQNLSAGHPEALTNLPWTGYSGGILANMTLLGYFLHKDNPEKGQAAVQAIGVLTSAVVIAQIFAAGFMPLPALIAVGTGIALGYAFNGLKLLKRLPNWIWNVWSRLLTVLVMTVVPQLLWMSLVPSPWKASWLPALIAGPAALVMMELERRGLLPGGTKERPTGLRKLWGLVGAWAATALFMALPIPTIVANQMNPEGIQGLAVGGFLMGIAGNLLGMTRAMLVKDKIWFAGAAWGVFVGGLFILGQVFWAGLASAALFWGVSAFLVGWVIAAAWLNKVSRSAK